MRVWRITSAAHRAFDGEGARRYGSRWTSRGVAVVYASATLSLAALERFVHTDPELDAQDLLAMPVDVADQVQVETVPLASLPPAWRRYPAPESLTRLGDEWVRSSRSALLAVPSVIIPHERNYVANPAHPDFRRLIVGGVEPFSFDPRMWKRAGRR